MSLLLEAILKYDFTDTEQYAVGAAGLLKIGDIVSDFFFIKSLQDFDNNFGSFLGDMVNTKIFLILACIFTAIGVLFDLYKMAFVIRDRLNTPQEEIEANRKTFKEKIEILKQKITKLPRKISRCLCRCNKKDDDDDDDDDEWKEDNWKWWKRLNLIFEEIPQLLVLVFFYISVRGLTVNCDIVNQTSEVCTGNNETNNNSTQSFVEESFGGSRQLFLDNYYFDLFISHGEISHSITTKNSIPKIIIQTVPDKGNISTEWDEYRSSLEEMNPDFKMYLFDDDDALRFVDEHFGHTILPEVYRRLPRPVMKADLFRLAAVAVLGGFYMDADMYGTKSLSPLVDAGYGAIFPKEWWNGDDFTYMDRFLGWFRNDDEDYWQVGNYAFAAVPNHDFIIDALAEITSRCMCLLDNKEQNHQINTHEVLVTTGPFALTEIFHNGRKDGKYTDVFHMPGDNSPPLRYRSYGHNDWHKFGSFAEHMLSHSWVRHSASQSDEIRPDRSLQTDVYYPSFSPAPTDFFFDLYYTPSPAPSLTDFYNEEANKNDEEVCSLVDTLIEDCSGGQKEANYDLFEEQQELFTSTLVSTLFTSLTIVSVVIGWYRSYRKQRKYHDKHGDFPVGTNVEIIGLKSAQHFNGRNGIVKAYLKEEGRYTVEISDTKDVINAKADNINMVSSKTRDINNITSTGRPSPDLGLQSSMVPDRRDGHEPQQIFHNPTSSTATRLISTSVIATVKGLLQRQDLNEKTVHVMKFNPEINRYTVKVVDSSSRNNSAFIATDGEEEVVLLKGINLIFPEGTQMLVSGLSSESALQYNGTYGTVVRYSEETGRYVMLMSTVTYNSSILRGGEEPMISVKPGNVTAVV